MTMAYIIAKYSYTKDSLFHPTKAVGRYGEERLDLGKIFIPCLPYQKAPGCPNYGLESGRLTPNSILTPPTDIVAQSCWFRKKPILHPDCVHTLAV